ncbi:MAG: hypothetical protein BYD32DRAFT_48327 [Podila humilis]|nr:MAG: hypothetical protein BYD32DRAFT_48327 [Podila humilis]
MWVYRSLLPVSACSNLGQYGSPRTIITTATRDCGWLSATLPYPLPLRKTLRFFLVSSFSYHLVSVLVLSLLKWSKHHLDTPSLLDTTRHYSRFLAVSHCFSFLYGHRCFSLFSSHPLLFYLSVFSLSLSSYCFHFLPFPRSRPTPHLSA